MTHLESIESGLLLKVDYGYHVINISLSTPYLIDRSIRMALRLASTNTKRIPIGDDDFIVVKEDISRRDFNRILSSLPSGTDFSAGNIDYGTASAFAEGLFDVFVEEWSVVDADDKPVPPTVENYQSLSREAATLVDEAITTHFNALSPSDEESVKSEGLSEE